MTVEALRAALTRQATEDGWRVLVVPDYRGAYDVYVRNERPMVTTWEVAAQRVQTLSSAAGITRFYR